MTLQPKKKLCSGCGKKTFLWRSKPPLCKDCCGRDKGASLKGEPIPIIRSAPLKVKPKPRVNGKPIHTAIYLAAFGYGDTDFIPSEMSGQRCQDVHHIEAKGMGSSKSLDRIENLMGLTREEHTEYGDKEQYMSMLYSKHMAFLEANGVRFDRDWILKQIERYTLDT